MDLLIYYIWFYCIIDALHQGFIQKRRQFLFHALGLVKYWSLAFLLAYFINHFYIHQYYVESDRVLQFLSLALLVRWPVFDLFINIAKGQHVLYVGQKAFFDRLYWGEHAQDPLPFHFWKISETYRKIYWVAKIFFLLAGVFQTLSLLQIIQIY
ncbi:MAG: hypothetical protein C0594_15375 [Marinilabiliales bacterium]|nr:MAG: hypothetical protein C0594_15375 [Marinilabiliales bacterium]